MTGKRGRKPITPTEAATSEQLETAHNIIMAHAEQQRFYHANHENLMTEIRKATTPEEKNSISVEFSEWRGPIIAGCPPTGLPALDRALPYVTGGIMRASILPLYLKSVLEDNSDLGAQRVREGNLRQAAKHMQQAMELLRVEGEDQAADIAGKLAEMMRHAVTGRLELTVAPSHRIGGLATMAEQAASVYRLEAAEIDGRVFPGVLSPLQWFARGGTKEASVQRALEQYIPAAQPRIRTRIIIDLAALAGVTMKPSEITARRSSENTELTGGNRRRRVRQPANPCLTLLKKNLGFL